MNQRAGGPGRLTPSRGHRLRPTDTRTGPRVSLPFVPHGEQATSMGTSGAGSRSLDPETAEWLASLRGARRDEAIGQLHDLLLRVARSEIRRRNTGGQITGPEVDDLAHQAAADALLLVTDRIDEFRGESRFTTWAYKFVVFEVSTKLGRHFWKRHRAPSRAQDWDLLPDRLGTRPAEAAELQDLIAAVRAAVETCLTQRQREVFTAIVVDGIPLDALVIRMGSTRTAIYKVMFDARQKLRKELVNGGYIKSMETP